MSAPVMWRRLAAVFVLGDCVERFTEGGALFFAAAFFAEDFFAGDLLAVVSRAAEVRFVAALDEELFDALFFALDFFVADFFAVAMPG